MTSDYTTSHLRHTLDLISLQSRKFWRCCALKKIINRDKFVHPILWINYVKCRSYSSLEQQIYLVHNKQRGAQNCSDLDMNTNKMKTHTNTHAADCSYLCGVLRQRLDAVFLVSLLSSALWVSSNTAKTFTSIPPFFSLSLPLSIPLSWPLQCGPTPTLTQQLEKTRLPEPVCHGSGLTAQGATTALRWLGLHDVTQTHTYTVKQRPHTGGFIWMQRHLEMMEIIKLAYR